MRPLHRLSPLFGSLVLTALLAGCLGTPQEDTEVSIAQALAFEPIGRGQQGRLDTTERAIRDAATWAVYQDSLRPLRPFQEVNFDQEMVLLAAVPVSTGGYSVRFEIIERTDDGVTIRYLLSIPADDCRTTMGQGVVFEAVRLAHIDAPLHFIRDEEPYRCTDPR
jgi:hypothetical protein